MNGKEPNEHEAVCARCGAEAEWSYLDSQKSRIEVLCPDCGRYEISREQFDQETTEMAEIDESERG
jgi:predicted RNA-binding Zn-ribbon protein involved in translation (DUF1610 family)